MAKLVFPVREERAEDQRTKASSIYYTSSCGQEVTADIRDSNGRNGWVYY